MKAEVHKACRFLTLILRRGKRVSGKRLEDFTSKMEELLCERYKHHWHPQNPLLGSGFRCIRINHNMDPLIAAAAQAVGVSNAELSALPEELTLWVDPNDVCFRIGENGSICDINESVFSEITPRCKEVNKPRSQEKKTKESILHSNRDFIPVPTCVQC